MPNPNAIVSTTIRFEPAPDRPLAEMLRSERGLSVELDGGRRVRLDPANPRSAGYARVLEGLSRQRLPVYVEIDPATQTITQLLIPHVAHVVAIKPGEGTFDVELDVSHARHVLRLTNPDAADLERQLRDALQARRPILLTEDDAHDILDVRGYTPSPEGPIPPFPQIPPKPPPRIPWPLNWVWWFLCHIWWWIFWPFWWWFHCISDTRAQQIFDAMAGTSCDPLTVPAPCIPFLYPDDGCWGRAHEMCRLMFAMGLSPRKVWIDASSGHWLHVNTRNNPYCGVDWGWHVAPTLCVRGPFFLFARRMVIDPSLFTTPVTTATWKSVQGDPGATLTYTGADQFAHGGGTDPTYSGTNMVLAFYRISLQNRAIQVGPPPYANCP